MLIAKREYVTAQFYCIAHIDEPVGCRLGCGALDIVADEW